MAGGFGVGLGQQVAQAHGEQHAVEGLARAVLAQQGEEALPGLAVGGGVGILGGVAAGGVDQHGFVGKPPVAVAGAADALDLVGAELLGEGEAQAGVDQRGGLARARGADEDVPGQLVEITGRAQRGQPGQAAAAAGAAAVAQDGDRLAETLAQGGHFGGFGGFRRALAEQAVEELGVAGAGLEAGGHLAQHEGQHQRADDGPAGGLGLEGRLAGNRHQRADVPHHQGQGDQPGGLE